MTHSVCSYFYYFVNDFLYFLWFIVLRFCKDAILFLLPYSTTSISWGLLVASLEL